MINVLRKNASADDFEIKLSNVAEAEITQRLPSLSEYKVGFQLIERDDEGTRGMGVMVYKIGDQWIYVPCFLLNGRIRGYDMMYLPEKSQFVPAKDSWVSYIKSNRATVLGEPAGDMPKSNPKRADGVSLRRDGKSNSIMFKGASDNSLLRDVDVEDMLTVYDRYDYNAFDLRTWIPRLGKHAFVSFMRTMNGNPDFANAVLAHYEPESIRKIAAAVQDQTPAADGTEVQDGSYSLKVEDTVDQSDLQVVSIDDAEAVQKLDDKAKEVVLRDGLYVVDNREYTSTVFTDKQDSGSLSTPVKNGYYEILLADGSFRKCYVIVQPQKKGSWKHPDGGNTVDIKAFTCVVIDLDRPSVAVKCEQPLLARTLEAREATDLMGIGIKPTNLLRKFDDAESDGPAEESPESDDTLKRWEWQNCIAIDSKGNYQEFRTGNDSSIIGNKIAQVKLPCDTDTHDWVDTKGIIELTGKPGEVCRKGTHLYIPEGARIVALRGCCDMDMAFGDIETIKHKIIKTAGWRGLTIQTDGLSFSLDSKFGKERMLTKNAALLTLIKQHKISAPDARQMLSKQASVGRPDRTDYLVKYAAPQIGEDDEKVKSVYYEDVTPFEENETLDPAMAEGDVDKVVKASEKGVKDVMDVSVLKALAANGSPSRMVEDYMQDLLLALDRIGRILFMFYWHYNQFKDQYGQEKMSELEDSLRDNFQNLSDLTLFLHKSTSGSDANLFADELTENFG